MDGSMDGSPVPEDVSSQKLRTVSKIVPRTPKHVAVSTEHDWADDPVMQAAPAPPVYRHDLSEDEDEDLDAAPVDGTPSEEEQPPPPVAEAASEDASIMTAPATEASLTTQEPRSEVASQKHLLHKHYNRRSRRHLEPESQLVPSEPATEDVDNKYGEVIKSADENRNPALRANSRHRADSDEEQEARHRLRWHGPVALAVNCSLELDISSFCRGILQTAMSAERDRIQSEISKYLPSWVSTVNLAFQDGILEVQPQVQLKTPREQALFGYNPDTRLRCTFEALLKDSKVQDLTRLLTEYSAHMCTAKAGASHCASAQQVAAQEELPCDPLGDVLITLP